MMLPKPKPKPKSAIVSIAVCALLAGAATLSQAQSSRVTPAPGNGAARPGGPVTLNFANAEIDAVARTMAVITGRNVVVDPRVKGTMTLVTTSPVSPAQALRLFSLQLRTQGFALVESAGLYLVVPEADAKLQSGAVSAGAVPAASGQILTQIFRLNHETANNLVPVLRPLISPNNTINVNPGNNSLVITDYADNLQRIGTIIAALDVANATGVEVIRLQHAIATDLAPLVTRLIDSGGAAGAAGQADTSFRTTLLAEPRSNSLILRAANPARLALVRTLVERLDQAALGGTAADPAGGNIYVVYLKNADATKLAVTLRAALAASAGSTGAAGPAAAIPTLPVAATGAAAGSGVAGGLAAGSLAANQPSTGGQIQAEPATNSLIITAPEPQYRQLRAVIDKLDGRRAQVLVESLIVEVNADKAAEFGIQWQGALGKKGDTNIGVLGTNFSIGGTNIISLSRGVADGTTVPSTGANFGIAHRTNGIYVLGFLARFLESNGDGNVLSTPNLLTLDNEEAKIVIGENVPFVTGQFTNTGSSANTVNPFQTIERKDVGLTLRVRPQINENGTVKMVIYQETSAVKAGTEAAANGPTTTKRSIESSVLVDDGAIVVLGGLLQDDYSGNQEKVPGLGDIPLFGNLFKGETRRRKKSNLMVFLRPMVVRDAPTSDALSMDRYDLMRAIQKEAQPVSSVLVPVNEAAVLPPLRQGAATPTTPVTPVTPISQPAAPDVPATPPAQ
ncbi:MAG TPA: type II secretion system secretin GspD [Polaromonas sp.]